MPSSNSDRNLLFGILALQMDLIRRDDLIKAMNDWVLNKDQSLGSILVQSDALSQSDHDLLEQMVSRHVEFHEGDPQKSLSALSSVDSIKQDLAQIQATEIATSLTHLSIVTDVKDADSTVSIFPASAVGEHSALDTRFRIIRPHAEGGLGKVSVAIDSELNREVALKEIKGVYAYDDLARARFMQEAEITGGLEHPGIVPVYGLGHRDDGQPFYAMRFIKGDSLKDACAKYHEGKANRSSSENAVEFRKLLGRFIDVCNAIEYAHSRGILHRDLKPGNIMLGKYGETLVVDWGLAKPIGRDEEYQDQDEQTLQPGTADTSPATQMGSAIGTPHFMSPEQAAGKIDRLGPRSDVYSLGATLYYLLLNRAPFVEQSVDSILENVQAGEFLPPREIDSSVPKPLEAVCRKAMAVQADARYGSPRELAFDLERWMADEPVSADRESMIQRLSRFERKHRTWTIAGTFLLVILTGISFASAGLIQSALHRETAARTRADKKASDERVAREEALQEKANAVAQAELADDRTRRLRQSVYNSQLAQVAAIWERFPSQGLALLEDTNHCPLDLRDYTWGLLYNLCDRQIWKARPHRGRVQSVCFSKSGQFCVTAGGESGQVRFGPPKPSVGEVNIWRSRDGKLLHTIQQNEGIPWTAAISPDEQTVVFSYAETDARGAPISGGLLFWSLKRQSFVDFGVTPEAIYTSLDFSPDGRELVAARFDGAVELINVEERSSTTLHVESGSAAFSVAFSPEGDQFAAGCQDGRILIWSKKGELLREIEGHDPGAVFVEYTPNGDQIISGGEDRQVNLWSSVTGDRQLSFQGHSGSISSIAISPDGETMLTSSLGSTAFDRLYFRPNGEVKLWDTSTGKMQTKFVEESGQVWSVAFAPGGDAILWGAEGGAARLMHRGDQPNSASLSVESATIVKWRRDGETLATANSQGLVELWDAETLERTEAIETGDSSIRSLEFIPRSSTILACGDSIHAYQLDGEANSPNVPEGTGTVSVSNDGKLIAMTATDGKYISVIDSDTHEERSRVEYENGIRTLSFSPGDRFLVAAGGNSWGLSRSGELILLELDGMQSARALSDLHDYVNAVTFSNDGKYLAIAFADGSVQTRALSTGDVGLDFHSGSQGTSSISFSPDDRSLYVGVGGAIKTFDTQYGMEQASIDAHMGVVSALEFSPERNALASTGDDGRVQLYTSARPWEKATIVDFQSPVLSGVFSATGDYFVTGSGVYNQANFGEVAFWNATTGEREFTFDDFYGAVFAVDITPDGERLLIAGGVTIYEDPCTVVVMDTNDKKELFRIDGLKGAVVDARFSPDGQLLATSGDTTAQATLWDAGSGERIGSYGEEVLGVDFAPGGENLATLGGQGLQIYDIASSELKQKIECEGFRIRYAPDGESIAVAGQDIKVFSVATGELLETIKTDNESIFAFAWSPDGSLLASTGSDGMCHVWSFDRGKEIASVDRHRGKTCAVCFSKDGRYLLTGGEDMKAKVWLVSELER